MTKRDELLFFLASRMRHLLATKEREYKNKWRSESPGDYEKWCRNATADERLTEEGELCDELDLLVHEAKKEI